MLTQLPALNAFLNSTSAVLLVLGFVLIRKRKVRAHQICTLAALGTSTLFLISYLTYHFQVGSVRYTGQGPMRTVYFTILISHTILAMAIVPMVLRTLYLAAVRRFDSHRRAARWTLPIWLYVSVTGVVIYEMLY